MALDWDCLSSSFFPRAYVVVDLGRLQLCAACHLTLLCFGRNIKLLAAGGGGFPTPLRGYRYDLPRRIHRRKNITEHNGGSPRMSEAILFFFIVVAGTGGELCVSRAMKSVGEIHDFRPRALLRFIFRSVRLPWMWAGIGLMSLGFFSLLAILSFRDVSFVVPVSALSYTAGAFGAQAFLGERITRNRWLGIAVVTLGVTLVWWSRR